MHLVKTILVLCALHFIGAKSRPPSSLRMPLCNDPARGSLEKLWESREGFHESLYLVRNVLESMGDLNKPPEEYLNIQRSTLDASSVECPHGQDGELHQNGKRHRHRYHHHNDTKLCPSYDIINYDENRIPQTLFEKKCSCQNCYGMKDKTTGCVEIKYHTKVLRRVGCSNNEYIYKLVLEPLVVACSCDHSSRPAESKQRVHNT